MEPIPPTSKVLHELIGRGDVDLPVTLLRMGRLAKGIVPECVGLSLALLEDGLTFTLVASAEEVSAWDAVQYLDGGPCVDAAHEDRIVEAGQSDVLAEDKWRLYAQATAAAGVASSLTLPILRAGRVFGTVNLYAAAPRAFEGHHGDLADALMGSAENAVTNADLSFSTRLEAAEAPSRLADEDDIGIALGIIAASQEVDIPIAKERLREAAARAGITEGQAARAIRQILHP